MHLVKHFLHEPKEETNGYIPRFVQFLCLFSQFMFFSILFEEQAPELSNKICQNLLSGWLQVQHSFLALWLWVVQKNNSSPHPDAVYLTHNYEYACICNIYCAPRSRVQALQPFTFSHLFSTVQYWQPGQIMRLIWVLRLPHFSLHPHISDVQWNGTLGSPSVVYYFRNLTFTGTFLTKSHMGIFLPRSLVFLG